MTRKRHRPITDESLRGNADNKGGHGADMRKHYTRVRLPTRAHVTVELQMRDELDRLRAENARKSAQSTQQWEA